MQDLQALQDKSLSELRIIAKALDIKGQFKKDELIARIIHESSFPEGDNEGRDADVSYSPEPSYASESDYAPEPTYTSRPDNGTEEQELRRRGRRPKISYDRVETVDHPAIRHGDLFAPAQFESLPEQESSAGQQQADGREISATAEVTTAVSATLETEEAMQQPQPKKRGRKPKAKPETTNAPVAGQVESEPVASPSADEPPVEIQPAEQRGKQKNRGGDERREREQQRQPTFSASVFKVL